MKTIRTPLQETSTILPALFTAAILTAITVTSVRAADRTWNGGGSDDFWSTPANWGGAALSQGDSLIFGGSVRTSPNNDFPLGTIFGGIAIANPAGPFTLRGNGITLGGDVADNMPLVPETIQLSLALNATRNVSVAADGLLTLNGVVSGTGFGLTKSGPGQLTLGAANSFNGPVTILGGTLSIATDANLGAAPGSVTARKIVINAGALRSSANLTLNANRGIALGPTSGTGSGTISVNSGTTLTYAGVVADNGGTGGLTKNGFGSLTLSGANTYTGPTIVQNGTLTLDYTQSASPANNLVSSSSSLTVGGANAGLGAASYAALTMNGKGNTANSQTFNNTVIDIGPAIIRANSASGGSAEMVLGALTHNPGGMLNLIPPALTGGSGRISTTTPNTHGIIGGWATVGNGGAFNNITMGTEWASVDGSGNIVPYTGYTIYTTAGNLHSTANADTNLRINSSSGGDVIIDTPDAGTLTDVNTINVSETRALSIVVGNGNTLRLGQYGSIFKSDNANNITWVLGSGTTGGSNGAQDQGILTAGGAPDTPAEIVFFMNNGTSQSQGSLNVECKVTDNGSGPVSVVKAGPGSMKLRGHNTFSGGLYLLQGRLQLAGSEINASVTGGNTDGGGTGPIYVYPGAYIYLSGIGDFATTQRAISNSFSVAGLGTQQEQVGAIRFGNGSRIAGDVTLIGDSRLGGGNANTLTNTGISGKISGNFNLDIGAIGTINTFLTLFNPANDWTGTTTLNARNSATLNVFRNGASEVIPNGTGKGNVVMNGNTSTGAILWDLSGFNETVNGLSSIGFLAGCIISNGVAGTTSTLAVGDYDQTASFGGSINNGAGGSGTVALKKIGGGKQTLTGNNAYSGTTSVEGGTLALSGAGSIGSSSQIDVNGGTLDVSELNAGFTYSSAININNGALLIKNTTAPGITALSLSDARVKVASLGSAPVVADVTVLTTGATANYIDIASIGAIPSYPATFTIIKYGGTIAGSGFNFALGNVPTPSTQGYVTNNEANASIDLVLLDGPKPLTWAGTAGPDWDINNTVNWLAFGVTPSVYLDVDSVRFDDLGVSKTVNLTTRLQPGAVTVNNNLDYTFTGAGKLSGPTGLTKDGAATLIIDNTGTNDFFGPLAINAGTVQIGNNDAGGSLGGGITVNNSALVFARADNAIIGNKLSGSGSVTQKGTGILTLSGDNTTLTGAVTVAQSTLKAGSSTAFGTADGRTTVNAGATLDVNGQNITTEPVTVSGSGVGDAGAIVNTGPEQQSALRTVTLASDVYFGGTSRWDIRNSGGNASLQTGGNPFKITKVGANQVSLVAVGVDATLGDIEIREGTFSIQTTTSQVGDSFGTVTVFRNATLGFFNLNPTFLNKVIFVQDGGIVFNENGRSGIDGSVTLEGASTFNAANTGTSPHFVVNGPIDGPGGITKIGSGPMTLAGNNTYSGPTVVTAGTLIVDGNISGSSVTVSAGTLAGLGGIFRPVIIESSGRLSPGNLTNTIAGLTLDFEVTLNGTTVMDVNKTSGIINADLVAGFSSLSYGGVLQINATGESLAAGESILLFSFSSAAGAFSSIVPATPGTGLSWDTSHLVSDGTLRIVAQTPPDISAISVSGTDVVLTGTGGAANGTYRVYSSTNVALPLINWTPITTNNFDGGGNFNFTAPIDPNSISRFFILRAP